MIQAGKNITAVADELHKIQIDYLFRAIKDPKPEMKSKLRQLSIVRNIDTKQYAFLKKQLPYFVCGIFNPNIRRTENFAYANYFVIDIDHISEKGLNIIQLRTQIERDQRVLLSFISPSGDGLKILFKLQERCYDAGVYSLFYKLFLAAFSSQYGLEQVADNRTSDVTRACFISFDANIYYNPQAQTVNLNALIDDDNTSAMFREKKILENTQKKTKNETEQLNTEKTDVDNDVISHIKSILHNAPKPVEKPPAYVPEKLIEIAGELQQYIEQAGITVKEMHNISYG